LLNLEILQKTVKDFIAELNEESWEWKRNVHESAISCMETKQLKSELILNSSVIASEAKQSPAAIS